MSSVKNKKKKKKKKLTFSTTETKYLCLLHIILHLITTPSTAMFDHCVILCLYILVALMPFGIFK